MKVKEAFKVIMGDETLRNKFKENPIATLKEQGVDTSNIPPEVLDKITGGIHITTGEGAVVGFSVASA